MATISETLDVLCTDESKPRKSAHSIWLDDRNYRAFHRLCTEKFGVSSSVMLDRLLPALIQHLESAAGRSQSTSAEPAL